MEPVIEAIDKIQPSTLRALAAMIFGLCFFCTLGRMATLLHMRLTYKDEVQRIQMKKEIAWLMVMAYVSYAFGRYLLH